MDSTARILIDLSAVDDQLSEKETLGKDLALALEGRRAGLREAVPNVLLAVYDARGNSKRRPVIVEVRGGHCGGCHLRLPPQLDSTIRKRQSLYSCPHCGRLLYASAAADPFAAGTGKLKREVAIPSRRRTRRQAGASER